MTVAAVHLESSLQGRDLGVFLLTFTCIFFRPLRCGFITRGLETFF